MEIYTAGIILSIAGGILAELVRKNHKTGVFTFLSVTSSLLLFLFSFYNILQSRTFSYFINLNYPFGKVAFIFDQLSLFFILIISLGNILITIYSKGYLENYVKTKSMALHFICMALLQVSMILVVSVSNALFFLVAWEIMSVSSFLLVAFEGEKKEVMESAVYYLIAMHIGVLFIITGFVYGNILAGSLDFRDFTSVLSGNSTAKEIIFIFTFIGFGTKAGFVPLHSWLPKAHPSAPSHISAMMSALMLKTGIYGILRMTAIIGGLSVFDGYMVMGVSILTAVYGIIYALNEKDMKKLLAFSSIENIGIIGTGIGVGILGSVYGNGYMSFLGFGAAIMHTFSHSLFKSLLFLSAGNVYLNLHTKNMEKMGGLIRGLPVTAGCFLAGAVAITGLPPLNGFAGEFILYMSFLNGIKSGPVLFLVLIASFGIIAFVGAFAIITMTKGFSVIFLGNQREEMKTMKEKSSIKIAMLIYAGLMILAGLFPQYLFKFFKESVYFNTAEKNPIFFSEVFGLLQNISMVSLIFTGIAAAILILKQILIKINGIRCSKTWDCGYQAGNSRMAYTASSFSQHASEISKPFLILSTKEKKPEGIFPQESSLETQNLDIIDIILNKFIFKIIKKVFELVSKIQSRTAQQYVMYVIIFIILTFIWIIGGR